MTGPVRVILDVDTGTDDAVAIMLAALHPGLDLLACTTVSGNVDVATCTRNTLAVLDLVQHDAVPVHEGLTARSMPTDDATAARSKSMHGTDLPLPASPRTRSCIPAVDFLLQTYASPSDVTLVATAPLTNIAEMLHRAPGHAGHIPHLVVMGGGHATSNATPAAEFNIWADPEAAAQVLGAGIPKVTLVTLDATHDALVTAQDCLDLDAAGTPAAELAARLVRQRIDAHNRTQPLHVADSAAIHDALAVAVLIDPALVSGGRFHVDVECSGTLTRGRTVIDVNRRGGRTPNARVGLSAEAGRFLETLKTALAIPPAPRVTRSLAGPDHTNKGTDK